jgi:hypothetical protein
LQNTKSIKKSEAMFSARDLLQGNFAEDGKPCQEQHCAVKLEFERNHTAIRSVGQLWQSGRIVIVGIIIVVVIIFK